MTKSDVLQGTLAFMVLKTLDSLGPLHGYGLVAAARPGQRSRTRGALMIPRSWFRVVPAFTRARIVHSVRRPKRLVRAPRCSGARGPARRARANDQNRRPKLTRNVRANRR